MTQPWKNIRRAPARGPSHRPFTMPGFPPHPLRQPGTPTRADVLGEEARAVPAGSAEGRTSSSNGSPFRRSLYRSPCFANAETAPMLVASIMPPPVSMLKPEKPYFLLRTVCTTPK